jgi:hypothetical protein
VEGGIGELSALEVCMVRAKRRVMARVHQVRQMLGG